MRQNIATMEIFCIQRISSLSTSVIAAVKSNPKASVVRITYRKELKIICIGKLWIFIRRFIAKRPGVKISEFLLFLFIIGHCRMRKALLKKGSPICGVTE